MYELEVAVTKVLGKCTADPPMQPGDRFFVRDGDIQIPEGGYICMWALQSLLPVITPKEREIAEFTLALIDEYLPYSDGDWSVTIDRRSRRQHGYCEHNRRTGGGVIGIAAFIIEHASDDEIFDTVTHEVAHAICGPDEGHGILWQNVHKELGGNGERYARAIPGAPKGKYRADCPACEAVAIPSPELTDATPVCKLPHVIVGAWAGSIATPSSSRTCAEYC